MASQKLASNSPVPSRNLPKAWPQSVIYLSVPKYSANVNPDLLHIEKTSPAASAIPVIRVKAQAPSPLVRIQPISNPSHPARGQYGLFAAQNLHPDTFILTYVGFVHGIGDSDPTSDCDLKLLAEPEIAVDALRMGNEARFINDYRGVSAIGPNAEFRDVLVDFGNRTLQRCMGVFVLSTGKVKSAKRAKGITRGEEILVSYGKGFWSGRQGDDELRRRQDGT